MTSTDQMEIPTTDPAIPPELANHPRYRVLSQLGAGGMGMVYKAEHVMMGRTVAVKVMAQKYTANPRAVERFRREVRAAAKLAHPNIVTAFDADEAEGRHFLVMEYVEGVSLDRVVNRRGPLPVTTACHVARLVALGLGHAHSKGMVHRDIKPQNVMVNRKGQVKVLDFGLARLATDSELPPEPTGEQTPPLNAAVTATNMVMGTPDYLSPEQAKCSRDIDHRSDLYSLGCLLYFALTGRPPFQDARSAFDKVLAHTRETPPPVTTYRADIPADVQAALAKLMAKDPADRFASATEVAAALHPFAKSSPSGATAFTAVPVADPVPVLEAIPLFDFEVVEETPNTIAETVAVTPPRQVTKRMKKLPRKPRRNWKPLVGAAAVAVGAIVLLAAVSSLLKNAGKSDPTIPPPANNGAQAKAAPVPARPAARVLFAVPKRGLFLDDYEPVRARLVELGVTVTTAGTSRGPCGLMGLDNRPAPVADLAFSEVRPEDYDAILFPGADVFEMLTPDSRPTLNRIVQAMDADRKVIGGICVGQRVLLQFNLLRDRNAALPSEQIRPQFERQAERVFGVKWDNWRRVVTDGHVVTASGAEEAREFADAVFAAVRK